MSDEVRKAVEEGQRAAIAAARRFVDTVDEAIPTLGGRPSRREQVIDAAVDMADRLVTTQYDFLRSVVRSARHGIICQQQMLPGRQQARLSGEGVDMARASDSGPSLPRTPWWQALRVAAIGLCVLVGTGLVLVALTFGSCEAFGGTCPSTPEPILEDDVFGMAALGAGLAVGAPVFLARPSRRRALLALAWGVGAAVVVGQLARSATNS